MSGTKKARRAGAVVVTANRLIDGAVVWRGAEGWVERFEAAEVLSPEGLDAALAAAEADVGRQIVVGVYAAGLDAAGRPASWKERIRAFGPTVV